MGFCKLQPWTFDNYIFGGKGFLARRLKRGILHTHLSEFTRDVLIIYFRLSTINVLDCSCEIVLAHAVRTSLLFSARDNRFWGFLADPPGNGNGWDMGTPGMKLYANQIKEDNLLVSSLRLNKSVCCCQPLVLCHRGENRLKWVCSSRLLLIRLLLHFSSGEQRKNSLKKRSIDALKNGRK